MLDGRKPVLAIMVLWGVVMSGKAEKQSLQVLSAWVSDHMVLPASVSCTFCGKAEPGAEVVVCFGRLVAESKVDGDGNWMVEAKPFPLGLKGDLTFSDGTQKKVVRDVVVGDLWICSGQSNMMRPVSATVDGAEALGDVHKADIRFFNGNEWLVAATENVERLPAVPFFFAAEMAQRRLFPVGVFVAARGGTGIEAWVPATLFPDTGIGRRMLTLVDDPEVLKAARQDQRDVRRYGEHRLAKWGLGRAVPSMLFEELVRAFGEVPMRGVVWYQGESNTDTLAQAHEYDQWLEQLIAAYRDVWNNPSLPFVIIQLPEYDPGSDELREAWAVVQAQQAKVAGETADAVLVEIAGLGDLHDIHPRRKKEVGRRAASAACSLLDSRRGK